MWNSFSYERFRTQTRSETEALENSEMAYLALSKHETVNFYKCLPANAEVFPAAFASYTYA